MGWIDNLNDAVATSRIGRYFQLEGSGAVRERKHTRFTTELRAGITTFFAMAYIISVNASILSASGGICECQDEADKVCLTNTDYALCVNQIRVELIAGTIITCMISCFLIGVFANLPLGLAPGMGLNAYFTYTVVGFHGSGPIPYRTALAAVFIEGLIFVVLTLFGLRQLLARIIPMSIKIALAVGIGLFLCFIGLQSSEGIGLVGPDAATLVTLAACPSWAKNPETGACEGHTMESPTFWMGILGLVIMSILMLYRVRGALLIGIIFIAITSWPRESAITLFPYTETGQQMFDYFKQVVKVQSMDNILVKFDFDLSSREIWVALITFLYVDILDTTGTMYSMAKYGGYVDKTGDFERSTQAFLCDAVSVAIGACFGVSPVTAYVESGAGIAEGGRTGITALMVSFMFFISVFFSPIFASFPPWATGPALVLVGTMMCSSVRSINWDYPGDAIPAFITLAVMPFTYSIAYGIVAGVVSYAIINGFVWLVDVLSGGRIHPDYSLREDYWTSLKGKPFVPAWIRFLYAKSRGRPFDWHEDEHEFDDEDDYDEASVRKSRDQAAFPVTVSALDDHQHKFREILSEKH